MEENHIMFCIEEEFGQHHQAHQPIPGIAAGAIESSGKDFRSLQLSLFVSDESS
jgi:hypothetical protein